MHQQGIARRTEIGLKYLHVAQVLNGGPILTGRSSFQPGTQQIRSIPAANAVPLLILQDNIHEPMHDRFLWAIRKRRDHQAAALPEWEELREIASRIKEHALTHLDQYLEEFERNATRRGAQVHWARDAAEHNEIVLSILQAHGVEELIKSAKITSAGRVVA